MPKSIVGLAFAAWPVSRFDARAGFSGCPTIYLAGRFRWLALACHHYPFGRIQPKHEFIHHFPELIHLFAGLTHLNDESIHLKDESTHPKHEFIHQNHELTHQKARLTQ